MFDVFSVLPDGLKNTKFVQGGLEFASKNIPLYEVSFGWVVITLIGFIFALIVRQLKNKNLHLLRNLSLVLQVIATIILFQGIYDYFVNRKDLFIPIFGLFILIISIGFRYIILKNNFYVQKLQKSKAAMTIIRFGTILGFLALYFLPNIYFINSIIGGILFNLGVLLNDRYLKYYTEVEYNEYMKNK